MYIDKNLNDLIDNIKDFFEKIDADKLNFFLKLLSNDSNFKKDLLNLNLKINNINKLIQLKEYLLILDKKLNFYDSKNPYTYLILSYLNKKDIIIFKLFNNKIYNYYYQDVIKNSKRRNL